MVEAQLKEKTVTSNPFELKKNKVEEALEDILEDRKAAFNKTNEENIKERQEKAITKLRKKKREELFQKKRNYEPPTENLEARDLELFKSGNKFIKQKFTIEDIKELESAIWSTDIELVHYGVFGFRKLLSQKQQVLIQSSIDLGMIPRLIEIMSWEKHPALQFEAAWSLTNIATGTSEQTKCIIDQGGIPQFVRMLTSKYANIQDQAVWALGNLAGENIYTRDKVIQNGVLPPLLLMINNMNNHIILRNGSWCLSNLSRYKPVNMAMLKAIPTLAKIVIESQDKSILSDCVWALSYLTDGGGPKIVFILETEVVPRIVQLLGHPSMRIVVPCLRILGNITTGSASETQTVINAGGITGIGQLLVSHKTALRKEAGWVISNITAGNPSQLQACFDLGIIQILINIIEKDHYEVRREAIWGLCNAASKSNLIQFDIIVKHKAVEVLCNHLELTDPRMLAVILEGLGYLLKKGSEYTQEGINPIVRKIDECGGAQKIENLQTHENSVIYNKCMHLLETYFSSNLEEELFMTDMDLASTSVSSTQKNLFTNSKSTIFDY